MANPFFIIIKQDDGMESAVDGLSFSDVAQGMHVYLTKVAEETDSTVSYVRSVLDILFDEFEKGEEKEDEV